MTFKKLVYVDDRAILHFRRFKTDIFPFITTFRYDVKLDVCGNRIFLIFNFNENGEFEMKRVINFKIYLLKLFDSYNIRYKLEDKKYKHFNINQLADNLIIVNLSQPTRRIIF